MSRTPTVLTPCTVEFDRTPAQPLSANAWTPYHPTYLARNAKPHPAKLVRATSLAMRPIIAPEAQVMTYKEWIDSGALSDVQLEQMLLATSMFTNFHTIGLRGRIRTGYGLFLGAGVGKTAIGIGLHTSRVLTLQQGHASIFVSRSNNAIAKFREEAARLGLPKRTIIELNVRTQKDLDALNINTPNTIYMTTHAALRMRLRDTKVTLGIALGTRLGSTYSGLVFVDEADEIGNGKITRKFVDEKHVDEDGNAATRKKLVAHRSGSQQGIAMRNIDENCPNACIVYASASAMPRAERTAYAAERLHFVGVGTPFASTKALIATLNEGVHAEEAFLIDAVGRGLCASMTISLKDAEFENIHTKLSDDEWTVINEYFAIYRRLIAGFGYLVQEHKKIADAARANWTTIPNIPNDMSIEDVEKSFKELKAKLDAKERSAGSIHFDRWMRALTLSINRDAALQSIRDARGSGEAIVIQLSETNDADVSRQVAAGATADDIVTSHKSILRAIAKELINPIIPRVEWDVKLGMLTLTTLYPNAQIVPSMSAFEARLLRSIDAVESDDHLITSIYDEFPNDVTEITGRSTIITKDANGERIRIQRSPSSANKKALAEFQGGQKPIIIIATAGVRNIDLHASAQHANQAPRTHLIADPSQRPELLWQGLLRTTRTGQVAKTKYLTFSCDLPFAQMKLGLLAGKLQETGALSFGDGGSMAKIFGAYSSHALDQAGVRAIGTVCNDILADRTVLGVSKIAVQDKRTYYGSATTSTDPGTKRAREYAKLPLLALARTDVVPQGGIQKAAFDAIAHEREKLLYAWFRQEDLSDEAARPLNAKDAIVVNTYEELGSTVTVVEAKLKLQGALSYEDACRYRESSNAVFGTSDSGEIMLVHRINKTTTHVITPTSRAIEPGFVTFSPLKTHLDAESLWKKAFDAIPTSHVRFSIVTRNIAGFHQRQSPENTYRQLVQLNTDAGAVLGKLVKVEAV
ncbi:MAG: strawberry notch-like NTP hydrolase domain-containing protein [Vulcanimicrobiaceae bacterium]